MRKYLNRIGNPIKRHKRAGLLLVITLVLAGAAALAFPYLVDKYEKEKFQRNSASCSQVIKESNKLLSQKKTQEAYTMLKNQAETCTKPNIKTAKQSKAQTSQEKVRALQFNANLAGAANRSGDKKEAFKYAEQVLAANRGLTAEERLKISEQPNIVLYEMLYIKQDHDQTLAERAKSR